MLAAWLAAYSLVFALFFWVYIVLPLLESILGIVALIAAYAAGFRPSPVVFLLLLINSAAGLWIIDRGLFFEWPAQLLFTARGLIWLVLAVTPAVVVGVGLWRASHRRQQVV
jgi:hypothetical protein